jgi:hypothetical protein
MRWRRSRSLCRTPQTTCSFKPFQFMCYQACACFITVIDPPISPCQSNSCLTFSTKQLMSTHYPFWALL